MSAPSAPPPSTAVPAEPPAPPTGSAGDGGAGRGHAPAGGWARVLVAVAAVLALLLVGATAGLLIAQSRSAGELAAPAADSVAVGFSQDMSVHHRQAIRMAGIVRNRSTDRAVQRLAFDIETNQLEQVGRMQGWLNLWGRDPLPVNGYMAWMNGAAIAGHGTEHTSAAGAEPSHAGVSLAPGAVAQMPGLASNAELARLTNLTGRDLDVLFLQLMLRHHQGGLTMIRYAAEHAEVGVVRNLAAQMNSAQTNELELLTTMITERGGTPLPAPN